VRAAPVTLAPSLHPFHPPPNHPHPKKRKRKRTPGHARRRGLPGQAVAGDQLGLQLHPAVRAAGQGGGRERDGAGDGARVRRAGGGAAAATPASPAAATVPRPVKVRAVLVVVVQDGVKGRGRVRAGHVVLGAAGRGERAGVKVEVVSRRRRRRHAVFRAARRRRARRAAHRVADRRPARGRDRGCHQSPPRRQAGQGHGCVGV
jgi:hypothetical protein